MHVFPVRIPLKELGWMLLASFMLGGCQYQFGRGELSHHYATVEIPYVKGDLRGELTTDIIKKLSTSGALRYVTHAGDLVLKIELSDFREENIAFRYDRKQMSELKKSIIPTETRLTVSAEVCLIEGRTGQKVREPTRITASVEFDHTYYATPNEINIFSLGQVNDFDAARDSVMHALNRNLAEKIGDYVINSW